MAKRVERSELRLQVTSWDCVLVSVVVYVAFKLITSTTADATPKRLWEWVVVGGVVGLYLWGVLVSWDYRSYAKRMLPLVNGCPDHPNYHGKSNPDFGCMKCVEIRQALVSLFPEERKPVG